MERVRQMNEKMNVLDVQLDNCTAKDAMKIIAEYMQTEELNTVDIVTVDTLMRATQLDGMKEELEKLDDYENYLSGLRMMKLMREELSAGDGGSDAAEDGIPLFS